MRSWQGLNGGGGASACLLLSLFDFPPVPHTHAHCQEQVPGKGADGRSVVGAGSECGSGAGPCSWQSLGEPAPGRCGCLCTLSRNLPKPWICKAQCRSPNTKLDTDGDKLPDRIPLASGLHRPVDPTEPHSSSHPEERTSNPTPQFSGALVKTKEGEGLSSPKKIDIELFINFDGWGSSCIDLCK